MICKRKFPDSRSDSRFLPDTSQALKPEKRSVLELTAYRPYASSSMLIFLFYAIVATRGGLLAKPNYQFEKRQRDLAKKAKQEEKRRQKLAGKADEESGVDEASSPASATLLPGTGTPAV
jgi:hypothetical protein